MKVPNVITFSGSRRGMSDEQGLENSVLLLNKRRRSPRTRA